METELESGIVLKFCRPCFAKVLKPSTALTEALTRLSESEEMRSFIDESRKCNRKVVLEVFHSSAGHPMLIHAKAQRSRN